MPDNKKFTSVKHGESYLAVAWPDAPANVRAYTTLRSGGVSQGDYASFNLAMHVSDDASRVTKNRQKLAEDLALPSTPVWLNQTHGNHVINAAEAGSMPAIPNADASLSRNNGVVCAVLTADCLPVFFCNRAGSEVAVAHAGWRGLHAGIISKTVRAMQSAAKDILVSLGPAIGPQSFEVGEEVVSAFVAKAAVNKNAFVQTREAHYHCDIYQLARNELMALGVTNVNGGDYCTYQQDDLFYSYRKRPETGRMANLIWLE